MPNEWTQDIPTKSGLYQTKCNEGDFKPDFVAITRRGLYLIVHCEYLGESLLDHYHNNLIDISWKRIS